MKLKGLKEAIENKQIPECFGTSLGGTNCWESCGDCGDLTYLKCLLVAKTLIDEAVESEVAEKLFIENFFSRQMIGDES